ncbi:MAG TPA: HAMP domain-containing sensor histidine kinase [Gemmata sp.]|nr:HAMP domain-containing sensor histidine kinase [Gemmata sp.]
MARPRRLRYKLMLGLGLVVGSIGLLLGGTLYGIQAYSATVRTTERKMVELEIASRIVGTLNFEARKNEKTSPADRYQDSIKEAGICLAEFRRVNALTIAEGLDPDNGEQETELCKQLEEALRELSKEISKVTAQANQETTVEILGMPEVKKDYENARRDAEHLRIALYDDIQAGIRHSNRTIRQSMWIVYFATAWALALVVTLLYYFRVWMFAPIRQLQAGVARVHSGDFGHPIGLASGDELQELADEFNAMTLRLAAIYADLARQVNERSRQLVRSERMVSVGFLAAGVAHEINNPLASILFCSEALERRLLEVLASMSSGRGSGAPGETEVLTRYLKMIQQEALRCKDITQKLLDFSRTGERKREASDLGGLVRGVLEVARHLPNCRGKEIVFDPKDYIVAPVNAQDLKSVILNLVVNALDSMDEGGRLTIVLGTVEGCAQLAFTDSGCGMTAEVLQNIFEPFFTRSRTGKGTGLGLFISHQIIDQHGGTIEASSPGPGLGSTFTVRVPLTESGGQEGPEPVIVQFPGAKQAA